MCVGVVVIAVLQLICKENESMEKNGLFFFLFCFLLFCISSHTTSSLVEYN